MPPNESITYITHNFKINLFKSFTIVPITEGMYTLRELLDGKIKAAQTMGRIYVDATDLSDKIT